MPTTKEVTIAICDCGEPYMWTYMFPYNEWYCIRCGSKHGMLGVDGETVQSNSALAKKHKAMEKLFSAARKHYVPPNSGMHECKKCQESADSYNHRGHLTKLQEQRHQKSKDKIRALLEDTDYDPFE